MTMYKSLRLVSFVNNTPLFYTTHFASTRVRKQRAKKKKKCDTLEIFFFETRWPPSPLSLYILYIALFPLQVSPTLTYTVIPALQFYFCLIQASNQISSTSLPSTGTRTRTRRMMMINYQQHVVQAQLYILLHSIIP